jgi:3-hydroxyisobutyrate dehydrogenase-like beta-hydroxyacid dehydrogenase
MHVGFVGLGEMGLPMVERLRAADHPVTFFARRPDAVDAGRALGAEAAASAAEAARDADVMIVCVYSDAQVRDLALGDGGVAERLKPGATLVIHTTGSPRTAEDIAAVTEPRGAHVLDAPVSGGPAAIRAGAITLLVGGDEDVFAGTQPVLSAYGAPIVHLGPLGSGQRTKLVNNLLFGAHVRLVAEAERLLTGFGMAPKASFEAITNGSGDSAVLRIALQMGSAEALLSTAGRFVEKDVATAEAVAAELGADTGLLGLTARGWTMRGGR